MAWLCSILTTKRLEVLIMKTNKIKDFEMLSELMNKVGLNANDREEAGTLAYVVNWLHDQLGELARADQINNLVAIADRADTAEFVHTMCGLAHAAAVTDKTMTKDHKILVDICADAFEEKYKKGTLKHFGFIPKEYYPEWIEKGDLF
jgi:hypothetical protein